MVDAAVITWEKVANLSDRLGTIEELIRDLRSEHASMEWRDGEEEWIRLQRMIFALTSARSHGSAALALLRERLSPRQPG